MEVSTTDAAALARYLQDPTEAKPQFDNPDLQSLVDRLATLSGEQRMRECQALLESDHRAWQSVLTAMTEQDRPDLEQEQNHVQDSTPALFKSLPESARIDPDAGSDACPWLDEYIAFSQRWSPRSFSGFHEACGIWVLSTVSARRVLCHYGRERFTNLYIMLAGRTTVYSKTGAADIAGGLLRRAGLGFLLAADETTPASFVKTLADTSLPSNFGQMAVDEQNQALIELGFRGQTGWYYDEFGGCLAAMMRANGAMADFRGLLRIFDDCKPEYKRVTISRGLERIRLPYLALLANATPADLKPLVRRGTQLWGDGFLARFAFITPPHNGLPDGRYPRGERTIPGTLIDPLLTWHRRLGIPEVTVHESADDDGNPAAKYAEVQSHPRNVVGLSDAVYDATYRYLDALMSLCGTDGHPQDLDGNYGRLHIKALRIALLFASLEGSDAIEMKHWARAQEIAERWRLYTCRLYAQVTVLDQSEGAQIQDLILDRIKRLGGCATANDIRRYMKSLSTAEIALHCDQMAAVGLLMVKETQKRTRRYHIAD